MTRSGSIPHASRRDPPLFVDEDSKDRQGGWFHHRDCELARFDERPIPFRTQKYSMLYMEYLVLNIALPPNIAYRSVWQAIHVSILAIKLKILNPHPSPSVPSLSLSITASPTLGPTKPKVPDDQDFRVGAWIT